MVCLLAQAANGGRAFSAHSSQMTVFMSDILSEAQTARPQLAVPPRPERPLRTLQLLKSAASNTLGVCDKQVFEDLIVLRRYGLVHLAFVSDPVGIRHVLVDRFDDYPRFSLVRRLYRAEIGTGTLASAGEIWRRHRRVAAPTLERRAIAPVVPELIEASESLADSLATACPEGPVNIELHVKQIWMQLLNRMVTGGDPRGLPILNWLGKVPRRPRVLDLAPMPSWLRDLVSSAKQSSEKVALRSELLTLIQERLAEGYAGPQDFLWRIAHGVDRQTGKPLPLIEMRDEASSQLAAGEASIRALTWIWYLLALHPDVERRLHEEIDEVTGGRPLEGDQIRKLVYTRRVLDEVIRLYPPIPMIVRQASKSDTICGQRIARGTIVLIAPWVVHRHRRLWSDPDIFDPDRFGDERSQERPRLAYIPFSAGPGVCTGSSYATTQMMIMIVALARRLRFRLVPDRPVVPGSGISLRPRAGMWMTIERR